MAERPETGFYRSAAAAALSQLWRVGVTLAVHLVLRRLVPRADWGLYDWAEVVFLVLGALRDLGLPAHTLRVRPRPFGNLLRFELGWGGLLSAAAFFGAPLLTLALSDPHPLAVPVLRAMALFLFFEGLANVPLLYFEGELAIQRALGPEILRSACFALTAVFLALRGQGVWSIVAAQVLASAVFAAALWLRARRTLPLTLLPGATPGLLRGSTRLAAVWLLVLLVRYVDRLILGARFSPETLGTYSFAYWAAFIVPMILIQPIGRAAFPTFIALAGEGRRQFEAYRLATLLVLALEAPAAWFLFVNAEQVLLLIGGGQWEGAPALLRILCFAPLVDPFSRFGGELLASRQGDRLWIAASSLTLLSLLVFGILLTGLLGPAGMAWANYLPLGGFLTAWGVARGSKGEFRRLAGQLAVVCLVPAPLFALAAWVGGGRPVVTLTLSVIALAAALLSSWRLFGRPYVEFLSGREGSPGEPGRQAGDDPPPC